MMWGYGQDGGALGWVGMAIFIGLLVALIVVVVWSVVRVTGQPQGPRSDVSLDILRQRFARGEISQAEFEEAKRVLGLK
jgi:putative membrane protein